MQQLEGIARTIDEVDDGWLAAVLDAADVHITSATPVGTGQLGQIYRLGLDGGPADSVVVKLAATDETSRGTGVGLGAYMREIRFYNELAPRLGPALPQCYHAAYDAEDGFFSLVLEDIVDGVQGDQITGCEVEEARRAVAMLARIQGPVMNDVHVGTTDYLNLPYPLTQAVAQAVLPGFRERYSARLSAEHLEVCERFVASMDAWAADQRPPLGLVHGDYRLDNLLFTPDGCKVVDWQTIGWGPAIQDLSYFIGSALEPAERRAHEEELVRLYHDEVRALGVNALSWETCWEEYRRQAFAGLRMPIIASMVVEQTERGDDMFMAWIPRTAQQIIDLGALDLLPDPSAKPAPLRPGPEDEALHSPGPEPTWNESYYFDAISDDGSLALYTRLGRVPNRDLAVFTASIVQADGPSILLVDHAAPLPAGDDPAQSVHTETIDAEQHCLEPLQRYSVAVTGTAERFADQGAPLLGERGEPVQIAFELTWETAGIPYAWRQTSRYEIPCRVTGTVTIDGQSVPFSGPGQRDHSWGARDWFASDWMWSAFHLDDGTHTHAVGLPDMPGFGVGYVQAGEQITELEGLEMSARFADDGLARSAELTLAPDGIVATVEPIGWGAIRFDAPDGRVAHFPRAACRVRTGDGRAGLGWIEWNRNVK